MSNYATRTSPQLSLPAGSTTGIGATLDNGGAAANHTVLTTSTVGITAGAVQLQGSLDNSNWVSLGSAITLTAGTNQQANVTGAPYQFVRAIVSTTVTGGSVMAWVASA